MNKSNKPNKFNKKYLLFIIPILISIFLIYLFSSKSNLKKVNIKDDTLGSVTIEGFNKNGRLFATNKIEVKKKDKKLNITGDFNNEVIDNASIELNTDDVKIKKTGKLIDGKLDGEGLIEQIKGPYIYKKQGLFKNDKLNGYGKKVFLFNGEVISEQDGFFVDDKLSDKMKKQA